MKYLVVGLGNIGMEYAATRHNIGFRVLDALAEASNISFTTVRYGAMATLKHRGRTVYLLKPSTYMNLSGESVIDFVNFFKTIFVDIPVWIYNTVIAPIGNFFAGMWNGLKTGAQNAWNGIKSVFSTVASFFKSIFTNAWNGVKAVFSTGGKIFTGIKTFYNRVYNKSL